MQCIYCCQSAFQDVCVFICSFCSPQKLLIKLPEAECRGQIPKATMLKYTTHKFPTNLTSFIQVKMKMSTEAHVYFAAFNKKCKSASEGLENDYVITLRDTIWSANELPLSGPDCSSFFFKSSTKKMITNMANLKAERRRKETLQQKIDDTMDEQEKVKSEEEMAKVEENIQNLQEYIDSNTLSTRDFYYYEDERTDALFDVLKRSTQFSGVNMCCKTSTCVQPTDKNICQITGGTDILMYTEKCCFVENVEDVQGSVNCEKKQQRSHDHELQINAEAYMMVSRNLYYQVENFLTFDQVKKLTTASTYAGLFEVGGRAAIWQYYINFEKQVLERTLKLQQPLDENILSVCYGKFSELLTSN